MIFADHLLVRCFSKKIALADLTLEQWDQLIVVARESKLLPRLAWQAQKCGIASTLDSRVRQHLLTGQIIGQKQRAGVLWESRCIAQTLAQVNCKIVLLKGGAYVASDLSMGLGRTMSDIDILVPREKLDQVEALLLSQGWEQMKSDAYDQGYYRHWMHELPPMQHSRRGTVIDVHHTILPLTGRLKPDPQKMLDDAVPIDTLPSIWRLSLTDMVLHSAAHLFQDGEISGGLRDLIDLRGLFEEGDQAFWQGLVDRAKHLNLERPLFYALRYVQKILAFDPPQSVMQSMQRHRGWGPRLKLMDWMVTYAILPQIGTPKKSLSRALAREGLYIRSHWLRMPAGMLIKHLGVKAMRRIFPDRANKC